MKNTFSQLCQLFNNLCSIDLRGDSIKISALQTAISALVFYIKKSQELDLYKRIKLSSEDVSIVNYLLSLINEFLGDANGQEALLTIINEMIIMLNEPH